MLLLVYTSSAPDEDRDGWNVERWLNQQRYLGVGLDWTFQFIVCSFFLFSKYIYIYYITKKWSEILIYYKVLNSWTRAVNNSKNWRVSFYGHLLATLSFMPHARQSSGDCQKKRLHSEIFENSEQYNTLCHRSRHAGTLTLVRIERFSARIS